jgi:hypothetical protein
VNIGRVVFLVAQKLEERLFVQWGHIDLQDLSVWCMCSFHMSGKLCLRVYPFHMIGIVRDSGNHEKVN